MATNFVCDNCDKIFTTTYGFQYHIENNVCKKLLGRKVFECDKCKKIIKSMKNYTYHTENNICEKKDKIYDYTCKTCNKPYSSSSSLGNHKRKGCKKKVSEDILKKLEDMEKGYLKLKLEMESMKNGNTTNIMNNTCINISTPLVKFGTEDINKLTKVDLIQALRKGVFSTNVLVEKIHFNPKYPENHNVHFSNLKDKYGSIYNGTKWETREKSEIINDLFNDKREIIRELDDKLLQHKLLSPSIISAIERVLDAEDDGELANIIKNALKLLIYDNRNFTKSIVKAK